MDERLELTEKQQEIIERYNAVVREMREANILCVFRPFEDIAAINGEHVEENSFTDDLDVDNGDIVIGIDDCTAIACPFGLNLSYNENDFMVTFKEN